MTTEALSCIHCLLVLVDLVQHRKILSTVESTLVAKGPGCSTKFSAARGLQEMPFLETDLVYNIGKQLKEVSMPFDLTFFKHFFLVC